MMLGRLGKRKGKPTTGLSRPVDEHVVGTARERRAYRLVLLLTLVVIVAALTKNTQPNFDEYTQDIESEVIAQRTWKADFSFQSEDLELTEKEREEAAQAVPDTYYVDESTVVSQVDELRSRASALRELAPQVQEAINAALLASDSSRSEEDVVRDALVQFATKLTTDPRFGTIKNPAALAVWLTPEPDCVPRREFAEAPNRGRGDSQPARVAKLIDPVQTTFVFRHDLRLEEIAANALKRVLGFGVHVPDTTAVRTTPSDERSILVLRSPALSAGLKSGEIRWGDVPRASKALENLRQAVYDEARALEARETPTDTIDWTELHGAAYELAALGIINTVVFDRVTTEGQREAARAQVKPVMRWVERGKAIQRDGDYWTEQSRLDLKNYLEQLRDGQLPVVSVFGAIASHIIFVGLALAMFSKSRNVMIGTTGNPIATSILILLIMSATVLTARVISYFEPSGYVVPISAASILLAILVNGRIALMVGFLMSGLTSIIFEYSWGVLLVSSIMNFAGVVSIFKVRRRNDMTRAALNATMMGLITMAAVNLGTDAPFNEGAIQRMGLVLMSGLATAFLVPGLLSPLERLFGITTDIQLLEYSDLNNEVLSRLAIEIPATYAHSLMLGQLAEAAADAIGANGLLARVCAYYHDIGKIRRPDYFSENQTGANVHDGLPPRLSARAIASHVTEGAEMAREYHLPAPIIDGIYEHHGTNLIGYFYQQALQQSKHGDLREEDFRYPGPKPRSRETAILMICDAVESGVRSIKNPNEERVREFVDKIITSRAEDRQFDDCDLTLKDLDTIAEVITRRMWTALHTRVAYPDRQAEKRAANVVSLSSTKEP